MYEAKFALGGWAGAAEHVIQGKTLNEIVSKFMKIQDLECLANMGRMMGGPGDEEGLDKLDAFLDKYYRESLKLKDLQNLELEHWYDTMYGS